MNQAQAEAQGNGAAPLPAPDQSLDQVNIGRTLLEPLNHGLAVSMRKALELGVPAHSAIEMLLNHLASVVAMVEPPGAREALVKQLVSEFAPLCRKHIELRFKTPGGVFLPKALQQ